MTSAKVTAMNQLQLSQRRAEEHDFRAAADLVRRAIANLKRDGEWYLKAEMASKILALYAHLTSHAA